MLAVDTNILVRYLTRDDPVQSPVARTAIDTQIVFVPATVLLETEWVLRKAYGYPRADVADALRRLAGLETVHFDDGAVVALALDWMERGMDFADALHLASAQGCTAFLTFDRRLAQIGSELSGLDVREP